MKESVEWEWGPASVATLLVCAVLAVVLGAGIAWVWVTSTYDLHAFAVTVLLAAVIADVAVGACIGWRLIRSGRQS